MQASIFRDPFSQGRLAVKSLYRHITQEERFEKDILIKPQIILKSNRVGRKEMGMKAIIVYNPSDIRMVDVDKPKFGPKDVLIKVAYSGICGTDLSILGGDMSFVRDGLIKYPVRIGHEWSGIVEEFGEEVEGFRKGDRVVADNVVSCGKCEQCRNWRFNLCENIRSVGTVNCWDGSFAEYMIMPYWHVYKVPDNIGLEEAALIEPATIALCGLKHSDVTSHSSILVVGTGPIGLSVVALAKNMGVSKVLLSGRKQNKLDIGKSMGADAAVNVTKENLKEFVMKNSAGKGVDAVIETSGKIETINQCLDVIKPKGILALIGFYETTLNHFPIDQLVLNQVHLIGIAGEFGRVPEVIEMMSLHNLNLKPMITHRFKFDEAVEAMKTAMDKNDTKIKMLVKIADI